jgi:hypothetical protein
MRYAYHDLGEVERGSTAVVRWRGSPADVLLLDPVNLSKYRDGLLFTYHSGGHYPRSPARLSIPEDGHWFAVVDFHGYSARTRATVEVRPPDAEDRSQPGQQMVKLLHH